MVTIATQLYKVVHYFPQQHLKLLLYSTDYDRVNQRQCRRNSNNKYRDEYNKILLNSDKIYFHLPTRSL